MCGISGCENKVSYKGLCISHYRRLRSGVPMEKPLKTRNGECLSYAKSLIGTSETECILWPFGKSSLPQITSCGKKMLVTRYLCSEIYGPPQEGDEAAHFCGKGHLRCVNPNHLRWASHKENEADKLVHGTRLRGESGPNSKLTTDQVLKIRERRKAGEGSTALAKEYGVSQSLISMIAGGKRWGHV